MPKKGKNVPLYMGDYTNIIRKTDSSNPIMPKFTYHKRNRALKKLVKAGIKIAGQRLKK